MDFAKSIVRELIPRHIFEHCRRLNLARMQKRNRHKSTEEVFSEVYESNRWGGSKGKFSSGSGTDDKTIVASYIAMIRKQARIEGFGGSTFVDLGCGDFRVGGQLLPLCSSYVGVDIVRSVIRRNHENFGDTSTKFFHLNIIDDDLPNGDVCFLRQVLQHLSNRQIACVLRKIEKYEWVFLTEHYPSENESIIPNKDKVHGADIRVFDNSGVYFSEPPFNLAEHRLSMVLEVPGVGLWKDHDQGVIRTFLYKPEG